jgi:NAD(P)-dependent dehydrogenase (short-subunit alcohol dehydrogenase family)
VSGRPVALVTGARRGIGRAIATLFAASGFDVALADLERGDDLVSAAQECRSHGAQAEAFAFDLADIESHIECLARVSGTLGPVDCLVNNAGVSVLSRGDLLDVTPESYDRCLAVNTRGTFFLTQAVARAMLAAPAREAIHRSIVTVTSSNAVAASILRGEYCVSKAGLSMASRLFALRLADHGIGVYEIQPGLIATEMTAPSRARYDGLIEGGGLAERRWGEPGDVARVALTAAQGLLPYTVGLPIPVDGGLLQQKF